MTDNERYQTKKITLPVSGKELEYVTEISAGVWIDLEDTKMTERTKFLIERLITSFDGRADKVFSRIKTDLRAADYMAIERIVLDLITEERQLAAGDDKKKALARE